MIFSGVFTIISYVKEKAQNNLMKVCLIVNGIYAVGGRKITSAVILHRKINRQYGIQKALFWPGRKRTACSKAGSQDNRIQSGVFKERIANPTGMTDTLSICPKKTGSTQPTPHIMEQKRLDH